MTAERYFERRQIRQALDFARSGGIAVHRNFDHYDGHHSIRGLVMTKPFVHVIGRRPLLEEWGRRWGLRPEWIQPEKRREVAHYDVFGEFAQRLIDRLTLARDVAEEFRRFASVSSPLYASLSERIAEDAELLALAGHTPPGQPAPNLLFATVHFLLLKGARHPLAAHYPSVSGGLTPSGSDPFPQFRDFCLTQAAPIAWLLMTRTVQTNEVARSACLLPGFEAVSRRSGRPLAIVEIGSSAGLNLNFDLYGYEYGSRRVGSATSPVQLAAEVRGDLAPPLPKGGTFPETLSRGGIDLRPVDATDPEQALWLRALVWPDQPWRSELLLSALGLARLRPPSVTAGDVFDILPGVVAALPAEAAVAICHSFSIYQFAPADRERLTALMAGLGSARDLYRLSLEWFVSDRPLLELTAWEGGRRSDTVLAACHYHGQWLHWLDPSSADSRRSGNLPEP